MNIGRPGQCLSSGLRRTLACSSRYRFLWIFALAGIVSLVVVSRHEERFREVSDGAILEISTIEALNGRQLLGPYSRFGWNHPGPLYFYLQAPWYLASGFHTAGMQAGALAINLAAIGVVAFVCIRRLRPAIGASIALMMVVYVIRVPDLLTSVWNPHVIILPMIAVMLLLGVFADTGRRSLLLVRSLAAPSSSRRTSRWPRSSRRLESLRSLPSDGSWPRPHGD